MKNILSDHSSENHSLINSRRRLYCQGSEDSSDTIQDNQKAILEFRRQIEQRFKYSISNKLYSFPRIINHISDIISSDEEQINSMSTEKKHIKSNTSDERSYDFKRKQKEKDDGRNRISTQIHTHELKSNYKPQGKITSKVGKPLKNLHREVFMNERLKTQPDCPGSFAESVRQKFKK